MELTEMTFKTTSRQAERLQLLASISGVTVNQALRALVYLGVEQALEQRAEHGIDLLSVHMIDKILSVEEAGAVDMTNEQEIEDIVRKQLALMQEMT